MSRLTEDLERRIEQLEAERERLIQGAVSFTVDNRFGAGFVWTFGARSGFRYSRAEAIEDFREAAGLEGP